MARFGEPDGVGFVRTPTGEVMGHLCVISWQWLKIGGERLSRTYAQVRAMEWDHGKAVTPYDLY